MPVVSGVADVARPPQGTGALLGTVPPDDPPRMRRLLYAEDNPVNVELVRQVVRMRPQWQLEVALNGAEAITMALTQPPDLLLLDMHLGDMNGLDVADRLAQHAHTAGVPKAGLSADAMPDQLKAARERGIVTYLTKPLEVPKLLQLLDHHASGQAGAHASGPVPLTAAGR
jgi:CheY-like chemotaxis protein